MDGNGVTPAYITQSGTGAFADLQHFPLTVFSGDADLATLIGVPKEDTHDACVLEFDFVPLGDTIKFNYVFSSEEYPEFACAGFNDAFAFFISGPGITGLKNIAIVPGTNDPVTIDNINDVSGCGIYPQHYISNQPNVLFTHNGHTRIFTAVSQVQPCQTYHLKLVIADVGDGSYDSGVFLEAKSLSSNAIGLQNLTQTDNQGNSYLVEGCATGAFRIKRPYLSPNPLVVNLSYGGTAHADHMTRGHAYRPGIAEAVTGAGLPGEARALHQLCPRVPVRARLAAEDAPHDPGRTRRQQAALQQFVLWLKAQTRRLATPGEGAVTADQLLQTAAGTAENQRQIGLGQRRQQ
jgi:hypothetical protein